MQANRITIHHLPPGAYYTCTLYASMCWYNVCISAFALNDCEIIIKPAH